MQRNSATTQTHIQKRTNRSSQTIKQLPVPTVAVVEICAAWRRDRKSRVRRVRRQYRGKKLRGETLYRLLQHRALRDGAAEPPIPGLRLQRTPRSTGASDLRAARGVCRDQRAHRRAGRCLRGDSCKLHDGGMSTEHHHGTMGAGRPEHHNGARCGGEARSTCRRSLSLSCRSADNSFSSV